MQQMVKRKFQNTARYLPRWRDLRRVNLHWLFVLPSFSFSSFIPSLLLSTLPPFHLSIYPSIFLIYFVCICMSTICDFIKYQKTIKTFIKYLWAMKTSHAVNAKEPSLSERKRTWSPLETPISFSSLPHQNCTLPWHCVHLILISKAFWDVCKPKVPQILSHYLLKGKFLPNFQKITGRRFLNTSNLLKTWKLIKTDVSSFKRNLQINNTAHDSKAT